MTFPEGYFDADNSDQYQHIRDNYISTNLGYDKQQIITTPVPEIEVSKSGDLRGKMK